MTAEREVKPLSLPVEGQIAVVNNMVLPLLRRTGIDVNVQTTRDGMTLVLNFVEPVDVDKNDPAKVVGTDDADNARMLWALREKIEAERAKLAT